MADLDWAIALVLAETLVTIGHPYSPGAIRATAADLAKWCKGCFRDGRAISPEEQAENLIAAAREWPDGWPEKGGTAALLALFRAMYKPAAREFVPASREELMARGLVRPPCSICEDRLTVGEIPHIEFCTACPEGRRNAKWSGDAELDRLNHPPAPPERNQVDRSKLEAMLAEAERVWRDEQERKSKQLMDLDLQ